MTDSSFKNSLFIEQIRFLSKAWILLHEGLTLHLKDFSQMMNIPVQVEHLFKDHLKITPEISN